MQKDINSVKGREDFKNQDSVLHPNTPGVVQKMPLSSTTPNQPGLGVSAVKRSPCRRGGRADNTGSEWQ